MVPADGIEPSISTTRQVMSSVPPTNAVGNADGLGLSVCAGVLSVTVGARVGEGSGDGETVVGSGCPVGWAVEEVVGAVVVSCGTAPRSVSPQAPMSTAAAITTRTTRPARNPTVPNSPSPPHEGICHSKMPALVPVLQPRLAPEPANCRSPDHNDISVSCRRTTVYWRKRGIEDVENHPLN